MKGGELHKETVGAYRRRDRIPTQRLIRNREEVFASGMVDSRKKKKKARRKQWVVTFSKKCSQKRKTSKLPKVNDAEEDSDQEKQNFRAPMDNLATFEREKKEHWIRGKVAEGGENRRKRGVRELGSY